MSKDLGCKWNFIVRNEASQEQGREDSSFDYFKEKERCLVREYIQNSMDAHSFQDGVPPYVIVEFYLASCCAPTILNLYNRFLGD